VQGTFDLQRCPSWKGKHSLAQSRQFDPTINRVHTTPVLAWHNESKQHDLISARKRSRFGTAAQLAFQLTCVQHDYLRHNGMNPVRRRCRRNHSRVETVMASRTCECVRPLHVDLDVDFHRTLCGIGQIFSVDQGRLDEPIAGILLSPSGQERICVRVPKARRPGFIGL